MVQQIKCHAVETGEMNPALRLTQRKERIDIHKWSSHLHGRAVATHGHKTNKCKKSKQKTKMEKGCFIMLDTFLMTLSAFLGLVKHLLSHCYHSVTLAQPHLINSFIRMESYRRNSALCYRDSSICVQKYGLYLFF